MVRDTDHITLDSMSSPIKTLDIFDDSIFNP